MNGKMAKVSYRPLSLDVRAVAMVVALGTITGWGFAGDAYAQGSCEAGNCPTSYSITDHQIQPVTKALKFQARISQAKMPLGDAVFSNIYVHIVQPLGNTLCNARYTDVRVSNGVLNLDLDEEFDCTLEDVIAKHNTLMLKVCIDNQENCLKPIELGTVPYAIKSTYAASAQECVVTQTAAQANYAHRATADTSIFETGQLGKGYFDFHTPESLPNGSTVDLQTLDGVGIFQWVPHSATSSQRTMVLAARANDDSPEVVKLSELTVAAEQTRVTNDMSVEDQLNVGDVTASVSGDDLVVADGANIGGTTTTDRLVVEGTGSASTVGGEVQYTGTVDMSQATVKLPASIQDTVTYDGDVIAKGEVGIGTTTPETKLHVQGDSDVTDTGGGLVQLGSSDGINLGLDHNEIQARNNGVASLLHLNKEGGNVLVGGILNVRGTSDVTAAGGGLVLLGFGDGLNLGLDQNEIQARNNGVASNLMLNNEGGEVWIGKTASMRVLNNGNVGIGTSTPALKLHINGSSDVTGAGGGLFQLGDSGGLNLGLDVNEIQARNNGGVSVLMLNDSGGKVKTGGDVQVGGQVSATKLKLSHGDLPACTEANRGLVSVRRRSDSTGSDGLCFCGYHYQTLAVSSGTVSSGTVSSGFPVTSKLGWKCLD